nr:MAG TPA: FeoB-associated Cys-rich membrane protein [Caudoviricetes sp.]
MTYLLFIVITLLVIRHLLKIKEQDKCSQCSMKELCKECRRNGDAPPCKQ